MGKMGFLSLKSLWSLRTLRSAIFEIEVFDCCHTTRRKKNLQFKPFLLVARMANSLEFKVASVLKLRESVQKVFEEDAGFSLFLSIIQMCFC